MKNRLKRIIFKLLRKDTDAVVVKFATGDPELSRRMSAEMLELVPDRRHFMVAGESGSTFSIYRRLRKRFRPYRIGLAPVLFTADPQYAALRRAAFLLAPGKILAYNARLERHHLRLRTAIASYLFLRGIALDRIWLRPKWLCPWKRDHSVYPLRVREFEGRPLIPNRKRIAVLSPYFPFPLSHGGAVRIFYLLREIAAEFDVFLLSFGENDALELAPVLAFCARILVVDKPRYREPRWASLLPPEVHEYWSPAMRSAVARIRRDYSIDAIQVEYTSLAPYEGDVLVEHDVTFHLHEQVREREQTLSAWWDYWRWKRFEEKWTRRYRRVVVMSEDDGRRLAACSVVIPNGVDLERFRPQTERPGQRLLFVGSFRHFPNVVACRFFLDQVWPPLKQRSEEISGTIGAGSDPLLHLREHTGQLTFPADPRIRLLGFIADVAPLYIEANLIIVPTLVSAGTNLKVLEAMAMERAIISTPSGCAGLGLEHGRDIWIANSATEFVSGIDSLLNDGELRHNIAAAGRLHAETNFGWHAIGARQRSMLRELAGSAVRIRRASPADLPEIIQIQGTSPEASQWTAQDYFAYDCHVAVLDGKVCGFLVSRRLADKEREILNVAVHPEKRRLGLASELIRGEIERWPGMHFLEVRQSNAPARRLYQQLGFEEVGVRPDYYENPAEAGIVMRIRS